MKFTDQHEWIRLEGNMGIVGITEYAAQQLGDVVFTELPAVGKSFAKGDQAAVVESVKAASEVYSPASGEIVEINPSLASQPELINNDPLGAGWFFKIKLSDPAELEGLMDESMYFKYVEESH